ncbi:adenosine kinase 2 isoform X2 [Cotesia typhae]|uniref:adenosine kinase 2 isoform X2 n=1 Tax=Cotesia typhae TaxID=2053667 RepID=UPI003D69D22D
MAEKLKEGLILGLGNPLLDISAVVDEDFLMKYNLKANNAILADESHKPLYDELIEQYKAEFIAGGAVQNTMRVAQWFLEKPHVATFMGCVGKDKYSKILEEKARSSGLNGFFLTVSPETIQEVAKHSHKNGKTFMMNLSAPFLCEFFKKPMMDAFPYVDIIFGNETEAEAFSKANDLGTMDRKEIALKMSKMDKVNEKRQRIVIITQGADNVILAKDNTIQEFPSTSLPEEKVVDTNGAGDAFVGGFIAQYVQGASIETCIKCGIWAATVIIQRSGCTYEGKPDFAI